MHFWVTNKLRATIFGIYFTLCTVVCAQVHKPPETYSVRAI